jgi:hypothetical protein
MNVRRKIYIEEKFLIGLFLNYTVFFGFKIIYFATYGINL